MVVALGEVPSHHHSINWRKGKGQCNCSRNCQLPKNSNRAEMGEDRYWTAENIPPTEDGHYIYLIWRNFFFKVGYTTNAARSLRGLQEGRPEQLMMRYKRVSETVQSSNALRDAMRGQFDEDKGWFKAARQVEEIFTSTAKTYYRC